MSAIELLLPRTRLESPATAGVFLDIPLKVTAGTVDDEEVQFMVVPHAIESGNASIKMRLDHSSDGRTSVVHTTTVIAATTPVAGVPLVGDASRATIRMDHLHREVWELLKVV